jgi:hypothetical protein
LSSSRHAAKTSWGAPIAEAVELNQDVIALLQQEPQVKLQALLKVFEPISPREHH